MIMADLSRSELQSLIVEEEKTSRMYSEWAIRYGIPALAKAAREEQGHAQMFKRLLRNWKD